MLTYIYFDTEGAYIWHTVTADNLVVEYEIMLSAAIKACFLISLELQNVLTEDAQYDWLPMFGKLYTCCLVNYIFQ